MSRSGGLCTCAEVLLPLGRFDHPNLRRRPANVVPAQADVQMDLIVGKECAGLRRDLRTTGAGMRRAFIAGRFGRNERVSLEWTTSGMHESLFPTWHSLCALTIFELARGMRVLGPAAGGYAGYLNRWGEDPEKALPSADGWTLAIRDCSLLPREAMEMGEGDPRREDFPEKGFSVLNVGGLRYLLPIKALLRLHTNTGAVPARHGGRVSPPPQPS